MPEKNSGFGKKTLTLAFKGHAKWKYEQPVELFFALEGKSASKNGGANVKVGDPNWYVYWQQVAVEFGFGPQSTVMVYDSADEDGHGHPGAYIPTRVKPWADKITIYDNAQAL